MIHVFKAGGEHTSNGKAFTLKCINDKYLDEHLAEGWFSSLEKALANAADNSVQEDIPESGSDYEAELRAKITALGGKAGGRSSIKTLEKQLAELQNDSEN